jgi:hypothetical protein
MLEELVLQILWHVIEFNGIDCGSGFLISLVLLLRFISHLCKPIFNYSRHIVFIIMIVLISESLS